MRAPGSVCAALGIETVMEHIAHAIKTPVYEVRKRNYDRGALLFRQLSDLVHGGVEEGHHRDFGTKDEIDDVWVQAHKQSNFEERMAACKQFNASHKHRKRGIAMVPINFNCVLGRGGAVVNIYYGGGPVQLDGSVLIHVTGCEIGQGLFTKCAQAASYELSKVGCKGGVPMEWIRVAPNDTNVIPNPSFTGASTTSEMCVQAVRSACKKLVERLTGPRMALAKPFTPFKDFKDSDLTWPELVSIAGFPMHPIHLIDLSASSFVVLGAMVNRGLLSIAETGNLNTENVLGYQVYGCAVSEVEVDTLTGETNFLAADLVYDAAKSLNPLVDLGQIQGAFMQGVGLVLREGMQWGENGEAKSINHRKYHAPTAMDAPARFNVQYLKEHKSYAPVYGSKNTGEPPVLMAVSVAAAVRMAIEAAREDNGLTDWVQVDCPLTPEKVMLACGCAGKLVS